jgi:hypothetical protein
MIQPSLTNPTPGTKKASSEFMFVQVQINKSNIKLHCKAQVDDSWNLDLNSNYQIIQSLAYNT